MIQRNSSQDQRILGENELRGEGKVVYKSAKTVKVKPQDDDLIITAKENDRLDALAHKYYGTSTLWYVIASVNNIANGSMHIRPGLQLRIPSKSRVI